MWTKANKYCKRFFLNDVNAWICKYIFSANDNIEVVEEYFLYSKQSHWYKCMSTWKEYLVFQEHELVSFALLSQIWMMFWSFAIIFFLCEFGELLSGRFEECYDSFRRNDWHLCTVDTQHMLLVIFNGIQDPITIRSLGNVEYRRDLFKRVSFRM